MQARSSNRSALCQFGALVLLATACSSGHEILVGYNRDKASGGSSSSNSPTAGTSATSTSAGSISSSGAPGNATALGTAGARTTPGTSTQAESCDDGGPAIPLPPIGGCTNDLAKRVFLFAICTCSDFVATNGVVTSPLNASATGLDLGASIGVNGSYRADGAESRLGGSLWVLGRANFGYHDILGELQCGSSVTVSSESAVHRNAMVVGSLAAPSLTIDGSLTVTEGSTSDVGTVAGGTHFVGSLALAPPCECENPIDIATIVHHFETNNDNARVALAPTVLTGNDSAFERSLPCGRYYFDALDGNGSTTLRLSGKTLIAVGGRLSNSGGLTLELGPMAELDLFVAGDLELSGSVSIGNATRPSATRVYVAGQAAFSSDLRLHANWYIPNSLVAMSAPSEIWGALHSQSLQSSAGLTVHYDESVLALPSCSPPGQSCGTCHDCANPTPACRNGQCEACQTDTDCCPPLYCHQGSCQTAPVLF